MAIERSMGRNLGPFLLIASPSSPAGMLHTTTFPSSPQLAHIAPCLLVGFQPTALTVFEPWPTRTCKSWPVSRW